MTANESPAREVPLPTAASAPSLQRAMRRVGSRVREDLHRALELILQEAASLSSSADAETRASAERLSAAAGEIAARLSRFEETAAVILAEELPPEGTAESEEEEDEALRASPQLTRALAGELSQLARHAEAPLAAGEAEELRPHIRRAARLANLWLTTSIHISPPPDAPAPAGLTSTHWPRPSPSPRGPQPRPAPKPAEPDAEAAAAIVALTDRLARTQHAQRDLQERATTRERYWREAIHELRNAAHAFMSWGFVLRRSQLKDTPWFAPLVRSAEAVLRRAEEALDPRHAEAASFPVQSAPMELVGAAHEALESIRPAADARNVSLAAATPGDGSVVRALGDADRVQQILHNLLRNAITATPAGGSICITVSDAGGPHIEVEDTGPGVPADILDTAGTVVSATGFGLGLRLSRALAERMGGSLSVAPPEPGGGARFVLALPPVQP